MTLKTDFQDGIYTLQIERPEARNALNRELRQSLARALNAIPQNTRLIRLMGTKEAFCAGQDLSEFDEKADVAQIMNEEYKPILDAIEAAPVPVIAGVKGACAGAGVSLALAADLVIASDDAFFQIAFGRIGLVPDILVSYTLPRLIGTARAMGLALSGERLPAKDAQSWGMIWRCIEAPNFDIWFEELSQQMSQGPSLALGMTRQMMRQNWQHSPAEQFALETEFQSRAAQSRDFREGVEAFMEKRPPQFKGQ